MVLSKGHGTVKESPRRCAGLRHCARHIANCKIESPRHIATRCKCMLIPVHSLKQSCCLLKANYVFESIASGLVHRSSYCLNQVSINYSNTFSLLLLMLFLNIYELKSAQEILGLAPNRPGITLRAQPPSVCKGSSSTSYRLILNNGE